MAISSRRARTGAVITTAVVFVVLMCLPALIMVEYEQRSASAQAQVFTQQQTLTGLAAQAVRVKLDALVKITASMASNPTLVSRAAAGDWSGTADAARDMQNQVQYYDSFIDRISIYDAAGLQQAAYPALEGGVGTSASGTVWYTALSSGAQTSYVGNVVLRASTPQIQIIGIEVPIKTASGAIVGFLGVQIPTSNFLVFGEDSSVGTFGYMFIVDSQGNIVADPKYSSENGAVVNESSLPEVAAVIKGKTGTDVVSAGGTLKSLVTYVPVPGYRWGVVENELYQEAFQGDAAILPALAALAAIVTIINILIAYLVFRVMDAAGRRRSE